MLCSKKNHQNLLKKHLLFNGFRSSESGRAKAEVKEDKPQFQLNKKQTNYDV